MRGIFPLNGFFRTTARLRRKSIGTAGNAKGPINIHVPMGGRSKLSGGTAYGFARLSSGRAGKAVMAAALLAILAGVMAAALLPGRQIGSALAAALRDPAAMFAARSPGQRPAGALTQTKPRLASAARKAPAPGAKLPAERVLSTGRTRPDNAFVGDAPFAGPGGVIGPAYAVPVGDIAGPSEAGITPGGGGPGLSGVSPSVPIGIGGGSGGGPGGGAAPTPTIPVPEVTSPVPEPSTWISMIVGLAMVGFALRRRAVARMSRSPVAEASPRDAG